MRAFVLPAHAEPLVNVTKPPKAARSKANAAEISPPPDTPRLAEIATLPRNRALVVAPQKGLVALKAWLRKLVMKPKKAALKVETASAKTQVRALRVEVAQLQRSLDQLMAQLKAIQ